MKSPAALLFDMDGVVVDNMGFHTEAWRLFFLDHGIRMNVREFLSKTSGMQTRDVLAYFFKRAVRPKQAQAFSAQKELLYRALYRESLRPAKGLKEFLAAARRRGVPMGLGTGSRKDNVDFVLDGLGLRRYFDAVVGGDDVRRGKPHPDTFLTLARKLGVAPRRCLVFEDSLLGESAARAAGMRVVAVTTSHKAREFHSPAKAIADFRRLDLHKVLALLDRS